MTEPTAAAQNAHNDQLRQDQIEARHGRDQQHISDVLLRFTSFNMTPRQLQTLSESRKAFRDLAADLILTTTRPGREQSLALTALEEAKYWTNQAIAMHGVAPRLATGGYTGAPAADGSIALAGIVHPGTQASTPTAEIDILTLPIDQDDIPNTPTLGGYLAEMLVALLTEGEGFSAKRPLGGSDWEGNIDDALTSALNTHDIDLNWGDVRKAITFALTGEEATK